MALSKKVEIETMAERNLAFHLIDRRNDHRAVYRETFTGSDDEVYEQIVWDWFDAGKYACCDYHRAHAIYGFGNPNEPPGLPDLDRAEGEMIVVERIVDEDSDRSWTEDEFTREAFPLNATGGAKSPRDDAGAN
jgi:hypothetical protein